LIGQSLRDIGYPTVRVRPHTFDLGRSSSVIVHHIDFQSFTLCCFFFGTLMHSLFLYLPFLNYCLLTNY